MQTPVLFLIFNRPQTTEKVFQCIRAAKPQYLYIAADGPRLFKHGEAELCEATRAVVTQIDWPCEVKTLFREQNLGCGKAISQSISWFFENVEEGIVLEDDILPHPDFFPYCEALLEKYRHDTRVGFISGRNYLFGNTVTDNSYYFSAFNHVWGWAGWRRTWETYDFTLEKTNLSDFEAALRFYFDDVRAYRWWKILFHRMKRGLINTWDYQLTFSLWLKHSLSIIPNTNLVENIGFGSDATHTKKGNTKLAEYRSQGILPLRHPLEVVQQRAADLSHVLDYDNKRLSAWDYYRKYFKLQLKHQIQKKKSHH